MPEELKHAFEEDLDFETIFYQLTQARQRGY